MQAATQTSRQTIIQEFDVETGEAASCLQIREKLDALLGGNSRLEETPVAVKQSLFKHLESCRTCCRAFDVRVRFRPGKGRGIF